MIYQGDCLKVLPTLEAELVQCCVTSPPYWGLRDYGLPSLVWDGDLGCEHEWGDEELPALKPYKNQVPQTIGAKAGPATGQNSACGNFCSKCSAWRGSLGLEPTPELYVFHIVQVFREVKRVLKDDGTVWLNLGDSYASGKGTCYNPGGGPSSLGKERKEAGAHPLDRGNKSTLDASGLKPKDLIGIPWRVAFALQSDGWYLRQDIIWAKPNPMPESVTDRCTKSHEYIFLLTKSARYFYDAEAIKESLAESTLADSRNSTGRHTQGKNYSKYFNDESPDNAGADKPSWYRQKTFVNSESGRNRRSVWTITTKPFKEAHFATFPPEIPEICIKAGSRIGDTILDPFAGACTTGVVAEKLGRKFVGIELNPEYVTMGDKRIYQEVGGLF